MENENITINELLTAMYDDIEVIPMSGVQRKRLYNGLSHVVNLLNEAQEKLNGNEESE